MRYTTTMNQEMKRRVTACAAGFSLPRYRELPSVGLYLDQTVQLVNSCFRGFPGVELTPSMVSNYVKKGVISHPVKKKYSREQLASLIYIVLSKNVLSLENIDTLFQMQRAHCTAAEAYDYFCDEVENCLPYIFGASSTICGLDPDADDEKRLLRGTIVAAVNKMYLDCCFVAMRQEEALWPGILGDLEERPETLPRAKASPFGRGGIAQAMTERASPSPESRNTAISSPFVRAMPSPRL